MGKRKAEEDLTKFVWKRNPQYDVMLLTEAELYNPYASKNQKPGWVEVAQTLREMDVRMNKVTDRSCRDRVTELLKSHRKDELASIQSSGISEKAMSTLKTLLTSVAKLEETKPNNQLESLYSREDHDEAEAIRSKALEQVNLESSDDENDDEDETDEDFDFSSKKGRFQQTNPKKNLITFLEKKTKAEMSLRKEELQIRDEERKNKSKELEMLQLKMETEAEERKKMMELLVKMASNQQSK